MFLPESLRLLLPDGSVRRILLEDYLRGVVAAALSADAPLEAQKALAVAARTFAANTHRHAEQSADVCTQRHCQAWNERANPRAARAVMETRGVVALYHDQLIEAFYFEHCDGKTREARGVLMGAPAYLKSVSCPCGFASMKGHGIGMCLRGMLAMARAGDNYQLILRHYYSGVSLQALQIDEATRNAEPLPPPKHKAPVAEPRVAPEKPKASPRAAAKAKAAAPPPTAPPRATTPPPLRGRDAAAPEREPEKPARKTTPPRRSSRPKIEQAAASETAEPLVTLDNARAVEADDLLLFLAVEDVGAPKDERRTTDDATRTATAPPTEPLAFAPPPSMPEALPDAVNLELFAAPPPSMPEELPRALELDFIAPPSSLPEDELGAPPPEFLSPAAHSVEPDLAEFMPPVEKFYTPLDAPPTMPEDLPSFEKTIADETPFAWVAPPPMDENAYAVKPPQVLMDSLPGPRVIAGNLPKAGIVVTIRDARGNSIVTVSGGAKQYGSGGFEAPLTDDGAYHVQFDGTELDISLESETVFIYYS